jgi:serine/threonine protein kinase/Tfp pilus assembly protein PilF
MISKIILHYKIIEKLGEGGMGVVFKAEDNKLKRQVAIKFLPNHIVKNSDERKRFEIEAQAAAALNHPNISHIYAIEEADDELFIVMEYIEGQELKEKLKTGPLTLDETLNISTQMAEGLQVAHENGIVHRDIKSSNIMITEKGKVKIMDFGLAKVGTGIQLTKEHSTIGTAAYMSPEQARGDDVDKRTDIWSFGVVLYEMLTGKLPFKGDYEQAIIYSILNEEIILSEDLPQDISKICRKTLAKSAEERYENVEQLIDDLNEIKKESGDRLAHSNSLPRRNYLKKKPILAISGVIIIILLIAAVYYFDFIKVSDGVVSSERKMLLVLPFENIGGNPEQEFFADGMTEEMITILGSANNERLGVIARTSAMYYKGKEFNIEDLKRELGVGYILEGSVRRQGDKVRIAANLIQVNDQTQLWSNKFDGTMSDIFLLQSTVATQIAEALAVELLQGSNFANLRHTPDPQAYEEYLTGRFYMQKGLEDRQKAIKYFEEAVRIDPGFASAYAALAHACAVWATSNIVQPKIAYEKASAAAGEALRLNPNLADVHSALAVIASFFEWNWQKAGLEFQRALELNPGDGETYHSYGHYLLFMDRHKESEDAFRNALKMDPFSAFHRTCLGTTYLISNRFKLAERTLNRAQKLSPELPLIYFVRGFLKERQGKLEEAILEWQNAVHYSNRLPMYLGVLGYGYGRVGKIEAAREILKELELKSLDGYVAAMDRAKVFVGLGEINKAFELLEQAYTNHEPWIYGLKLNAGFDPIRDDPRFVSLLIRVGVAP